MRSEWRVRKNYYMTSRVTYQVYCLKDIDGGEVRENMEIIGNYEDESHANQVADYLNNN